MVVRLMTFAAGGRRRTGAVVDGMAVDLGAACEALRARAGLEPTPAVTAAWFPGDLVDVIAAWDVVGPVVQECLSSLPDTAAELRRLNDGQRSAGRPPLAYALDEIEFAPPLVRPGKVLGIGLNYKDHAEETGKALPTAPMFFNKFATSLVGHEGAIVHPGPGVTTQVDFEAELAVVIGRRAKNVSEAEAMDCVFGYTIMNDVSARDLQYSDGQFVKGKALDTFGPMGPWIVAARDGDGRPTLDPHDLSVTLRLNDKVMQDGHTGRMIFSIPQIVAYLSRLMTLLPGDVIMTGTPAGVGAAREPKVFLQPGDVVEVEIERIGVLRNPVAAASR